MKKIAILLVTLFVSFMFSACNSNSMMFSEMKSICNNIENNFDKYTKEDFEKQTERFSELEKKLEAKELTSDEKKELARIKGRYYGVFTKGAIKATTDEFKKFAEGIGNVVEGFIEGVK